MSNIQLKITAWKEAYNLEKNQSKETDPERTEMMKVADKDDKRAIIDIVHMFKKEDEHLSIIKKEK